jgi:hypothetical protein
MYKHVDKNSYTWILGTGSAVLSFPSNPDDDKM